jgi:hypothetical protein
VEESCWSGILDHGSIASSSAERQCLSACCTEASPQRSLRWDLRCDPNSLVRTMFTVNKSDGDGLLQSKAIAALPSDAYDPSQTDGDKTVEPCKLVETEYYRHLFHYYNSMSDKHCTTPKKVRYSGGLCTNPRMFQSLTEQIRLGISRPGSRWCPTENSLASR